MIGIKGKAIIKKMLNPFEFKAFSYAYLPSLLFWKIKILAVDGDKCTVQLPYTRRNKNPFNSVYFASMLGAGELSTGILCKIHLSDRGEWSMLVKEVKSEFYKKTSEPIIFSCSQGAELHFLFNQLEIDNEAGQLTMISEGRNLSNELVVKVWVNWSFKQKQV
jgi:hypothetical protein